MNFTRIGGRRFTMAMGAGITATVLVWFGKINGDVYQWIVMGTVGAYITGGTVDSIKEHLTQKSASKSE